MPELITAGKIYVSMPPLYLATSKGKTKEKKYLYNEQALAEYKKKNKEGTYNIKRFKGLGEMDPKELWETTLNPENRVLKRVEIEDARQALKVTEMLMGSEVAPRREFIHKHALEAQIDS
jgi:DNA gyrase subunit B